MKAKLMRWMQLELLMYGDKYINGYGFVATGELAEAAAQNFHDGTLVYEDYLWDAAIDAARWYEAGNRELQP